MEPDELAAEQTLSRHRQHAVREPVVARGSGCRRRFTGIPPQRHDPIRIFHTLGPDGDGVLSNKSRGPLFLKHLAGSFVLFLAASNSQPMGRRPADARHALPRCPHCGAGPPQPTLESEPRFLMDGTPAALEPPLSPPPRKLEVRWPSLFCSRLKRGPSRPSAVCLRSLSSPLPTVHPQRLRAHPLFGVSLTTLF